ncbi:diguanylate cyclase [Colwellia piezophila]|uniref:diguanylate cyclase n=1 Tax=Colwellia piezophila TaxID=211668 RepID=UPI000365FFF0|nr:diguanylate cyclase [Colwellia piezophila]
MYYYQKCISILRYVNTLTKYTAFLALLICSVASISVSAQPYIKLGNFNKIELNEHNLWFKTKSLDTPPNFSDLSLLYQHANRVTSTLGGSGAYVTKIDLINIEDKKNNWFVNIHMNYLDIGTAYWQPVHGKPILLEQFGQVESKNPKLAHSQVFSLPLIDKESGTLWIYVQAKMFATPAVIKIYSKTEFYSKQFFINSVTTMSFTVMMTLALIAFFIYIRTKYLVTLACAGYIGLHGLGWFAASGSLGHLFTVQALNPVYGGILIFPFAIASASQFTKLLFNCQEDHIKLAKTFNLLSIVSLFLGLLMPFLPFTLSYLVSHIIAITWIPLCIGVGVFMLTKKDFRAKYYLTGNFLYGLALAVYVLSHVYKLDWDMSPELIVLVALTVDCICILLSLSEWLQIQQKEFNRSYNTSRIDPLTQIGNRFAQNEMLANLSGHYCLTFIDIDDFKKINDEHGHDVGDKFLIAVANIMQKKLLGFGSIFRCGGDEFILVVSIKVEKEAGSLIIQLSDVIKKAEQELQKTGWESAGLSFGIATSFETLNQSECLSLADQRMYKYKQDNKL